MGTLVWREVFRQNSIKRFNFLKKKRGQNSELLESEILGDVEKEK